jgi:hypothetical protein
MKSQLRWLQGPDPGSQRVNPVNALARNGRGGPLGQLHRSPVRPGAWASGPTADDGVPVHLPDRGLAARVLKENVGAVGAGSDRVPTRPGIGDRAPADQGIGKQPGGSDGRRAHRRV